MWPSFSPHNRQYDASLGFRILQWLHFFWTRLVCLVNSLSPHFGHAARYEPSADLNSSPQFGQRTFARGWSNKKSFSSDHLVTIAIINIFLCSYFRNTRNRCFGHLHRFEVIPVDIFGIWHANYQSGLELPFLYFQYSLGSGK